MDAKKPTNRILRLMLSPPETAYHHLEHTKIAPCILGIDLQLGIILGNQDNICQSLAM